MAQKPQPQKNKINPAADKDIRAKINTAKSTLGLKGLNVSAALAGHKAFAAAAAKSPNASYSQVLNKVAPNARQQYSTLGSAVPTDILDPSVPMAQFKATLQKLKQTQHKPLNNGYEITDKEQISESVNEAFKDEQNPPAMMVLRRQAIRIFPDGRRVALYTNKQLGLTFTIPYTPTGTTPPASVIPGVQEEVEQVEEGLGDIIKNVKQTVKKADVNWRSTHRAAYGADPTKTSMAIHVAARLLGAKPGEARGIGAALGGKKVTKQQQKAASSRVGKEAISKMRKEEVEHIEENIDHLKKIVDNKTAGQIKFKNGSSMKVDHFTASAIHQVHNAVNDSNKAKLAKMISHSPEQFKKVADFALSKTSFKINK